MGDGEKLLTHLNSALKVLLGLDIFPRVPKKKLNFVDQCNMEAMTHWGLFRHSKKKYNILCTAHIMKVFNVYFYSLPFNG